MNDRLPSNLSASILSAFAAPFSQENRSVRFTPAPGIAKNTLLAHRVAGREAISEPYRLDLECVSADAFIDPAAVIGIAASVAIQTIDGRERIISGLVTGFGSEDANGGMCRYLLQIEPAFTELKKNYSNRVFKDKTVQEIVAIILGEHTANNPVFARAFKFLDKSRATEKRSLCTQYREDEFSFLTRLLREEGISYYWRFEAGDAPMHTMVLFSSVYDLDVNEQRDIEFKRPDGIDTITEWKNFRRIASTTSSLITYDYKTATAHTEQARSRIDQGKFGNDLASTLEDYDAPGQYYAGTPAQLQHYATLRQQYRDLAAMTHEGEGPASTLWAGSWYTLQNHPLHDREPEEQRQFVVLSIEWIAQNNLPTDLKNGYANLFPGPSPALLAAAANRPGKPGLIAQAAQTAPGNDTPDTPYRCRFKAVQRGIPIVPEYSHTLHAKPTAQGIQNATVVGPPTGSDVHTNEHGCALVQFDWQRPEDHAEGGANFDDKSYTWVQVANSLAGNGWGFQSLPRIGMRVIIDYIEGDIDRPVIVSAIHSGINRTPNFSSKGLLPANRMNVGWRTHEDGGARHNELLFDDFSKQIKARLSSDHGNTQLNLGWIGTPRLDGQSDPRGEGGELATDEALAVRGGKGIVLTTFGRPNAAGNQLDRQETIGQLRANESIAKTLSESANTHTAEITETDKHTELIEHIENLDKGTNVHGGKPDPTGGKPIILITSPAGTALSSNDSTTIAAGSNIDTVSVKHTNITAGRRLLMRAEELVSLFSQRLGMIIIAAKGDIRMETHDGQIKIWATKKLILGSNEGVEIHGPVVVQNAQGAKVTMGGGAITTECQGTHTQKVGAHVRTGPGGGTPDKLAAPVSKLKTDERAVAFERDGSLAKNAPYRATLDNGRVVQGKTDEQGRTELLQSDTMRGVKIELLEDKN